MVFIIMTTLLIYKFIKQIVSSYTFSPCDFSNNIYLISHLQKKQWVHSNWVILVCIL